MSDPFIGEISIFSFDFAPRYWAKCDGQTMSINQNTSLYSLIGTTYGGNGSTNFNLPDLRGRVPIHKGTNFENYTYQRGDFGGDERVTLLLSNLPSHNHTLKAADTVGTSLSNSGENFLSESSNNNIYSTATNLTNLSPSNISEVGGNASHENMQPFGVLNFCISLKGLYPSRN